mgnify:CR=1 FL=1
MSKILVVDDDPNLLNLVKQWLELDQHFVVSAANGNQATTKMNNEEFDLIITDIVMPDKEGLGLIREIRQSNGDIPILAMSGTKKNSDTYLAHAKKLGADRILVKPLAHDFFIGTVNELLK